MQAALLDTDILNEVLKAKNSVVIKQAVAYLGEHGHFTISVVTRYEVLRGLKEKGASKQLDQFDEFCRNTRVLPITDGVFDRAADLWVLARRDGREGLDADLLIAATALENGLVLVTGNTKHFDWIPSLRLENWRNH